MRKLIGLALAGGLLVACGSNRGEMRNQPQPPPSNTMEQPQPPPSGMESQPNNNGETTGTNIPENTPSPESPLYPNNNPPATNETTPPPENTPQQ